LEPEASANCWRTRSRCSTGPIRRGGRPQTRAAETPEGTEASSRGQCYDHKFLRFSTIFGEKLAFSQKTNVMIKFAVFLAKIF
jgi:hypothetical protein